MFGSPRNCGYSGYSAIAHLRERAGTWVAFLVGRRVVRAEEENHAPRASRWMAVLPGCALRRWLHGGSAAGLTDAARRRGASRRRARARLWPDGRSGAADPGSRRPDSRALRT